MTIQPTVVVARVRIPCDGGVPGQALGEGRPR